MNILQLLANSNFIVLNKEIIKAFGLEEAIIIGELASEFDYWQKNNGIDEEGFFYSTIENIEERTSLTAYKQRKAFAKLEKMGVVKVILRGVPAKRFVKIIDENINSQLLKNFTSRSEKTSHLEVKKLNNKMLKNLTTSYEKTSQQDVKKLNGKNNINKNNIKEELISNKSDAFKFAFDSFIEMRKRIKKPLTDNAEVLVLKKLEKLASDEDTQIAILEQSVMNSWQGIFPLKEVVTKDIVPTYEDVPKWQKNNEMSNDEIADILQNYK